MFLFVSGRALLGVQYRSRLWKDLLPICTHAAYSAAFLNLIFVQAGVFGYGVKIGFGDSGLVHDG